MHVNVVAGVELEVARRTAVVENRSRAAAISASVHNDVAACRDADGRSRELLVDGEVSDRRARRLRGKIRRRALVGIFTSISAMQDDEIIRVEEQDSGA